LVRGWPSVPGGSPTQSNGGGRMDLTVTKKGPGSADTDHAGETRGLVPKAISKIPRLLMQMGWKKGAENHLCNGNGATVLPHGRAGGNKGLGKKPILGNNFNAEGKTRATSRK